MRTARCLAAVLVVALAACSSSSGKASTNSTESRSTTVTTSPPADTSHGAVTVTGGDRFSGGISLTNPESCNPQAAPANTYNLTLFFSAADADRRELDLSNVGIGTATLSAASAHESTPRAIRYSHNVEGIGPAADSYDWGQSSTATAPVTGTVVVKDAGKVGKLTADLPYAGDEGQHHPSNYYGSIHVIASWNCP